MRKEIIFKVVAVILTVILVTLLILQIEFRDIIDIFVKIKPGYLMLGFLLSAVSYLFRALRFHILLNREISIKYLFSIVSIHNMALNIFPARSGELSYIYMLKKRHKRDIGEGAATLITVKMFDIISISVLFLISAIMGHDLPGIMEKILPLVGFLLFFVILLLFMFIYQCSRFVAWLRNISTFLKLYDLQFIKYIFRKLDEMALSFERIQLNELILSLLISAMLWTTLYSLNYSLIIAMGINLPLKAVFLASTFFYMISILPIQGIGGFGTLEGSWALSFMAVGVSKQEAISSGFLMHFFSIFCLLILFIIGFLLQQKKLE